MAEIRLGPQDDDDADTDEVAEAVATATERMFVIEMLTPQRSVTYGPMTGSKAAFRASELIVMLTRAGGDVAVRVIPLTLWPDDE